MNIMNRGKCAYCDGAVCTHALKDAGEVSESYCNDCQEFVSRDLKHLTIKTENKPGLHPSSMMRIEGFKSRAEIRNFAVMVGAIIQGTNEQLEEETGG